MTSKGGRHGPRDAGSERHDAEADDHDDRTVPRWMGGAPKRVGDGVAIRRPAEPDDQDDRTVPRWVRGRAAAAEEPVEPEEPLEPTEILGSPRSGDDADTEHHDDRTEPRWVRGRPAAAAEPVELEEPLEPTEVLGSPRSGDSEDHDDRTEPRHMGREDAEPEKAQTRLELEPLPDADVDVEAIDAQRTPEGAAVEALDERTGNGEPAGDAELDETERLRRYRVRRSDGEYQFVTREELDALNVERKLRAARHEAEENRRHRIAMAIAGVSAALVVIVLVRALLPAPGSEAPPRPAPSVAAPSVAALAAAPVEPAASATQATAPATGSVVREGQLDGEESSAAGATASADAVAPAGASAAGGESAAPAAASIVADALVETPPATDAVAPPVPDANDDAITVRAVDESHSGAAPVVAAAPAAAEPLGGTATARRAPSLTAEVETAVLRWIDAWRSQDVDAYLASYAPDFSRNGLTPEAWARSRRNRLGSVPSIEISIGDIEVREIGPNDARAEFVQRYRDARYSDESVKVVLFQRIDGALRIVVETDRVVSR